MVHKIEVAHRKKRARMPEFTSDQERSAFTVEREVALVLVPLLPYSARVEMLGGKLGMSQVPSKAAQENFIHRLLKSRAGTDGSKIASARLALSVMRKYGATTLNIPDPSDRDQALSLPNVWHFGEPTYPFRGREGYARG